MLIKDQSYAPQDQDLFHIFLFLLTFPFLSFEEVYQAIFASLSFYFSLQAISPQIATDQFSTFLSYIFSSSHAIHLSYKSTATISTIWPLRQQHQSREWSTSSLYPGKGFKSSCMASTYLGTEDEDRGCWGTCRSFDHHNSRGCGRIENESLSSLQQAQLPASRYL